MTDKKGVSLNPKTFTDVDISVSLEELIASGKKPPKISSNDLKQMDIHSTGIYSVYEALQQRPIAGFNYWELSRCTSLVVLTRLSRNECIAAITRERQIYLNLIKNKDERVRKNYNDYLAKLSAIYSPFLSKTYLHIQFWDEDVKNGVVTTLADAGLTQMVFYIFAASVLSEVSALEKICDSLNEEAKYGLLSLGRLLVDYQTVNKELLG